MKQRSFEQHVGRAVRHIQQAYRQFTALSEQAAEYKTELDRWNNMEVGDLAKATDDLAQRTIDWLVFADRVGQHIENYTVPQYGDAPDDQVESWTAEHCVNQLHKYASRFGSNKREGQDALDLLKIAHYAQLAYDKLQKETQHGS